MEENNRMYIPKILIELYNVQGMVEAAHKQRIFRNNQWLFSKMILRTAQGKPFVWKFHHGKSLNEPRKGDQLLNQFLRNLHIASISCFALLITP